MQTKLTLRLEGALIEAAKRYADERGTSVSKLVASYLDALTRAERAFTDDDWKAGLSPATRQLVGLAGSGSGSDALDEAAYLQQLEEKHSRHLREKDD